MTMLDVLIDSIILYVIASLVIGQIITSHAAGYELRHGPKIAHALALIPYFFWVSLWWPKILYKLVKKEPW